MINWFVRLHAIKNRGFIGPKYRGLAGKLRLVWQGLSHEEIVSYAEPRNRKRPQDINPNVSLLVTRSFDETVPYLEELRIAYYRDFKADWERYFSWGQTVALALINGQLAGFGWIQDGRKSSMTYYMPLFSGEYRILRVGVLPAFRGQRVHTTFLDLILEHLFSSGANKVFIDAFTDNIYAWKGQHKAGFREIGRIRVRRTLRGGTCVRWMPTRKQNADGQRV